MKGKRQIRMMLLLIAVLLMPRLQLLADTQEELRLSIGSKLFPSMLAADLQIADKRGSDGALQILVVYLHSPGIAENVVVKISAVTSVRSIPLKITPIAYSNLTKLDIDRVGGIFIVEPLHDDLERVLNFAHSREVIVFSPFEGDVERGAHGGISVRDRILPFINISALHNDGIELKAFFLKVAEHYE